jgi:tRNA pseudouridine55 synthase
VTGIIIIDKPEGITSFGVISRLRKILNEKKIGHSGTLDPMATGVMTVLVGGSATRFCELLPSHDKAYEATLLLGTVTDTLDITGNVIDKKEVTATNEDFRKAAEKFKGEITQVPPMYSAVSVNGRRLYDLARQGIEVERPERKVIIYSLDILEENEDKHEYKIHVECSSGTYIRTLIADIGEKIGCGAVLTSLRRTKANGFTEKDALTLEELKALAGENRISDKIIPIDKALEEYKKITVTDAQSKRFSNGGELALERVHGCQQLGIYRVYSPAGKFLGLGENDGSESLQVKRVYTGE